MAYTFVGLNLREDQVQECFYRFVYYSQDY
jgi:hypothetical protein